MTRQITYTQLNELVHLAADRVKKDTGIEVDRYALNDVLSAFLNDHGFKIVEVTP